MYLMFGCRIGKKSNHHQLTGRFGGVRRINGSPDHVVVWQARMVALPPFHLAFCLLFSEKTSSLCHWGVNFHIFFRNISPFNPCSNTTMEKSLSLSKTFIYPNVLRRNRSQQNFFAQIITLSTLAHWLEMGIGLLAGLACSSFEPHDSIAYGELMAFGLLNFWIGNRAVFYSAPIFWFGAAFPPHEMARFIAGQIGNTTYHEIMKMFPVLMVTLAMVVAWVNSPTDYVPKPSFSAPVLSGCLFK